MTKVGVCVTLPPRERHVPRLRGFGAALDAEMVPLGLDAHRLV
jgi:hypothetical protein